MRERGRSLLGVIVVGSMLLAACGGTPTTSPSAATGFINNTQHTDAQLWVLWHAAQQALS
jgi:hypothetical protein